jgi:hypothetical protein
MVYYNVTGHTLKYKTLASGKNGAKNAAINSKLTKVVAKVYENGKVIPLFKYEFMRNPNKFGFIGYYILETDLLNGESKVVFR